MVPIELFEDLWDHFYYDSITYDEIFKKYRPLDSDRYNIVIYVDPEKDYISSCNFVKEDDKIIFNMEKTYVVFDKDHITINDIVCEVNEDQKEIIKIMLYMGG